MEAASTSAHAHGASGRPVAYERRRPELTPLHRIVREHLESFLADARERLGNGYPRFVENEFRRFLECGILGHGFARVRCESCGHDRLVAFSCRGLRLRLPTLQGAPLRRPAGFLAEASLPSRCEGPMRLIAVLTDPEIVRGILRHLGLPTTGPPTAAPARAPPQAELFEQPS